MTAPRELEGAELSAAVAMEVMGWTATVEEGECFGYVPKTGSTRFPWAPHASWADAMEVVAKLIAAEWCFGLSWIPSDEVWEATFDREKRGADKHHKWPMKTHCVEAPHGPTAICRAALLARAGEER